MNLEDYSPEELQALRDEYESYVEQFDNEQMARKILLNSAYGALGSSFFRFYDTNQATAITFSGQLASKWAERELNTYLQKLLKDNKDRVLAMDTDSCYVDMSDLVNKFCKSDDPDKVVDFLDTACEEKFHVIIDKGYEKLYEVTNAYTNRMKMKREAIANAFFTQKKRYALKVFDNEGVRYTNPEIKITGLEAVRSTTPEYCRNKMKELIRLIFDTDEETVRKFIANVENEYMSMSLYDVAIPTGVKNTSNYTGVNGDPIKGTPKHVKGAIAYNKFIVENDLDMKYELISDDDKVKMLYLREPNPFKTNSFCFPAKIPDEIDIDKYVDRREMYVKGFYKAVERILDAVGWKSDNNVSLKKFFRK